MFKKLLLKALKNLTPEEKIVVREFLEDSEIKNVDEEKSDTMGNENLEEGEPNMSNENEKTQEKVDEVEKTTENNEVEEKSTKTEEEVKKEEVVDEATSTDGEEKPAEPTEEEPTAPQVQQAEPQGNGVRVEDLVTKEELMERLSAFEAKFDAVVKENQDLKDKYENKDFGNFNKQGMVAKDKSANSSFEEYSRQFMD